jgi:AcrR family transcriptional regulator
VTEANSAPTRAERKRIELREEIVEAAFDEFSERGYHETGVADIARRVGIGHGTFYRHFENKRDILDHVIDGAMARSLGALTKENAPDAASDLASYREQAGRIADALYGLFSSDVRTVRMIFLQMSGVDAALEQRLLDLLGTAAALSAGYLENGKERGFLRPDLDVDATSKALTSLVVGGTLFALRDADDPDARRRYRDAAVALMFDGVA